VAGGGRTAADEIRGTSSGDRQNKSACLSLPVAASGCCSLRCYGGGWRLTAGVLHIGAARHISAVTLTAACLVLF